MTEVTSLDLFSQKLRKLVDERKISTKKIAKQLQITLSEADQLLQGERQVSLFDFIQLSKLFHMQLSDLIHTTVDLDAPDLDLIHEDIKYYADTYHAISKII